MGDGKVRREDRHGITKDQVFTSIKNTTLPFRKMIQTEETLPLLSILFSYFGQAALNSPGIVLEENGKFSARNISIPHVPKQFISLSQVRPCLFLLRQKVETKSGKNP